VDFLNLHNFVHFRKSSDVQTKFREDAEQSKNVQILTYWCCDRKAGAASAQSFTQRQKATINITCHDHSSIACLRHTYMDVILHTHPVRSESRIQRNANRVFATTSPPFYNEPHRSHVLFVKAAPGMTFTAPFCCDRKARAASAQNFTLWQLATTEITWHDHSIVACSRHSYGCYSSRTSRSWHIQRNANSEVATLKCCCFFADI